MINLLPPPARMVATREYWLRVWTVWALMVAAVLAAAALLLLPSYALVSSRFAALTIETDVLAARIKTSQETELLIRNTNERASQLIESARELPHREVVAVVDRAAAGTVTLNRYALVRDDGAFQSIAVNGVAKTRAALLQFQEELEREPIIASAAVPLADLAPGINLPFTMTLTIRPRSYE